MLQLRSALFSGLATGILFAGLPVHAAAPSPIPELASVSTFEACAIGLAQQPPSEVVEHSVVATSFLSAFADMPGSTADFFNANNRSSVSVGVVRSPVTGLGCGVAVKGADRDAALTAIMQRAQAAKSRWSNPVRRSYFGRSLWVSISTSGKYLLMIPEVGSAESEAVVIAENDVGGSEALASAPDNTVVIVRAALKTCASWVEGDANVDVAVASFESNPRIKVSKTVEPLRSCTVKALTADPMKSAETLHSALGATYPGLLKITPTPEMTALGYGFVSSDCHAGKSGLVETTISAAPASNDEPFKYITISFLGANASCQDLEDYKSGLGPVVSHPPPRMRPRL